MRLRSCARVPSYRVRVDHVHSQTVPGSFLVRPRSGTDMQFGGTQTSYGSRSGALGSGSDVLRGRAGYDACAPPSGCPARLLLP